MLILVISASDLLAQKKVDKRAKSKRQTDVELLERARSVKTKSPTEAIRLLEQSLNYSRKRKDQGVQGEAYILLGEIYEQIDQKELALQRYEQALDFLNSKKDGNEKASVYQKMGQIYLTRKNDKAAEQYFNNCIEWSYDKKLSLLCEEGLADVKLLRGDIQASASQLDSLEQNNTLDSIARARLEARRSQIYVQQKDLGKASEALQNSINSLPSNQEVDKTDYAPIEKAQQALLDDEELSSTEKIAVRSKLASNPKPTDANTAPVEENLKIAELYESEDNLAEAEKYVERSKALINKNTNAAVAADVYKKSSEYNQRKGQMDLALNDLEQYIQAKEAALNELENNLKDQIEIVKGQKQIDVSQRDYSIEEKDRALLGNQVWTQQLIIGFLSLLLLGSLVYFYFLYKNVREKRRANQLLLLKSLRTQMNPHFIFNALNSVNNFIAKNDEKAANKFLSEFSNLMRKVLDYSQKDFIAFEEEMELNELYLKLEHFRFREKFDYNFQNNAKEYSYNLDVPPMLIQPFIENAIWHGLRYKEDKGQLDISIDERQKDLVITIKDNGIGREKSKALKTKNQKKYKSTGLENVSKRMALFNEIYGKNYEVKISNLNEIAEDKGTVVEIKIPVS